MKITMFDSLDEDRARRLAGCKVTDENGKSVGTVDGLWMDANSRRVEFVGVKSNAFAGKVHVMPAGDAQIIEDDSLVKLRYPATLIKKAPSFSPGAELASVEKEEINQYCGRSRTAGPVNLIEELRPEEAVGNATSEESQAKGKSAPSVGDRQEIEDRELAFFNQNGFVSDSMPEVDASQELLRTQKEAEARNLEDRAKSGSSD
jgi:sporulation protein YlmC with PRC-barrel domain